MITYIFLITLSISETWTFNIFRTFQIWLCWKCGKFRFRIIQGHSNLFIWTINILDTIKSLKCLKCLLFTLLHFNSAIADFCRKAAPYALLVSSLRQKCYGLQAAISPFVNLRSAHLFLRYPYRSGTISALLFVLPDNINTPSLLLDAFCFKKIFSVIRHFDECCYLS